MATPLALQLYTVRQALSENRPAAIARTAEMGFRAVEAFGIGVPSKDPAERLADARPAVARALHHRVRPDHLTTVFAGQDAAATQRARDYFTGYGPSSPQIALFKDGRLVYMLERFEIEGRAADEIARDLVAAFDRYCERDTVAA
jgi:hypothetical protein